MPCGLVVVRAPCCPRFQAGSPSPSFRAAAAGALPNAQPNAQRLCPVSRTGPDKPAPDGPANRKKIGGSLPGPSNSLPATSIVVACFNARRRKKFQTLSSPWSQRPCRRCGGYSGVRAERRSEPPIEGTLRDSWSGFVHRRLRHVRQRCGYSTAPMCQGTNSVPPKPRSSLLVRAPLATAIRASKISAPFSASERPSAMSPQLISISSPIRA